MIMTNATKSRKNKSVLVESRNVPSIYDMSATQAIIDTPKSGRILITELFGGIDTQSGGMPRWRHGVAVQLLPTDTFDILDRDHNDIMSILTAAINGSRVDRPLLRWQGPIIDRVATRLGL
jgi:hypothetical protein